MTISKINEFCDKYNVQAIAVWVPSSEEKFQAWKTYTKSSHGTLDEYRKHIKDIMHGREHFPIDPTVEEFDRVLKEMGQSNTPEGRSRATAFLAHQQLKMSD